MKDLIHIQKYIVQLTLKRINIFREWVRYLNMIMNSPEIRKLSILSFISAVFVVGGFYLTMLPIGLQILLLLVGVINGVATLIGIIKYLIKVNK